MSEPAEGYVLRYVSKMAGTKEKTVYEGAYSGDGSLAAARIFTLREAVARTREIFEMAVQMRDSPPPFREIVRVRGVAGEDEFAPLVGTAYAVRSTVTGKVTPWPKFNAGNIELVLRIPGEARWEVVEE